MKKLILFLSLLFYIFSCSNPASDNDGILKPGPKGAFILNEGNFGQSNGSLSFYYFDSSRVENNIFERINNRKLGDVVQSMTLIGDKGYIVINGSGAVEVISLENWKSRGTINIPAGSPRTIIETVNGKAYVTSLYAGIVSIIDLEKQTVTGAIPVGTFPDAMVLADDKVFVANGAFGQDNSIFIIDPETDQVIDSVIVADGPVSLNVDLAGNIQVFCTGDYGDSENPDDDTDGGIYTINPKTHEIVQSVSIPGHPDGAKLDGNGKGYYSLNGTLYSYETASVSDEPVAIMNVSYYGMNIDKVNDRIYVLDAKDFAQAGDLKIYTLSGNLLETYMVDIIPNNAVFYHR